MASGPGFVQASIREMTHLLALVANLVLNEGRAVMGQMILGVASDAAKRFEVLKGLF